MRTLQCHLNVAALHSQVEASALVLHKVQGHFWEALLLKVADNGAATQVTALDHTDHLVVLALQQRQLEHVLCHINLDHPVLAIPVQRKHSVAHDFGDVQRHLQGADDAAVSVGQAVLDVVQGGVDEHAVVIPGGALDADGFVHRLRVLQPLVRNDDGVLAEQRHHAHVRVPHHILHGWGGQLRQAAALLHVQKCDLVFRAAQQHARACIEDGVRARAGQIAALGDLVLEVADLDVAQPLVERSKAIARDEDSAAAQAALCLRC
mmetsp:Transcript_4474/g.12177  ORF Transcript_4474/g.12177 Transcript_4474/m.12177 type:complete len:264 (-) Transcript_4474:1378-2169(-)